MKSDYSSSSINRRTLIKKTAAVTGVLASAVITSDRAGAASAVGGPAPELSDKSTLLASDSSAVVETTAGKVRGYTRNGIYTFKGIPYGAPPTGKLRFMPPAKVAPWSRTRSSLQYGNVSPQPPGYGWDMDETAFLLSWDHGVQAENCLRVNVWTEGINDQATRPVVVWLHGGGFETGSSQELKSYDGENLARRGVVLVSLNHRLGVLGYLDLSAYGERYALSANVGMLDIVAALEWVRENIANFGGDPGNVTIFGQSGGGGKVGTLMAMPRAQGLFHKASIHSGSMLRAMTTEKSQRLAAAVLSELGLSAARVDELHAIPYEKLIAAGKAASRNLMSPGPLNPRKMWELLAWGPVVDGEVLAQHPFDPVAPAISARVPLLVGTVLNEFTGSLDHPEYELWTDDEARKRIAEIYPENGTAVFSVFRRAHPRIKPLDIYSLVCAAPVRVNAVQQAERKAAQGSAPAYLWWLTWQSPLLDGRVRAPHCSDLPFVFDNTDRCDNETGGGARPRALAARMSQAWVNFARSGNPNHPGLPDWPPFSADKCPTMIFDDMCGVENNPDGDERQIIQV